MPRPPASVQANVMVTGLCEFRGFSLDAGMVAASISTMSTHTAMSAIAYTRVSTDDQAESGLGLAAQRHAITAAAKRLGLTVTSWCSDEGVGGSAPIDKRLGLVAAIDALTPGAVLLVAKRDRVSRDVFLGCYIDREVVKKKARIVSAAGEGTDSDDPSSMLHRRIIDAFSEYERQIIRARTKAALRAKMARGERVGSLPFGYRLAPDGQTLLRDQREQRGLALIRSLRESGHTLREIVAKLESQGIKPKRGAIWYPKTVANLCRAAG